MRTVTILLSLLAAVGLLSAQTREGGQQQYESRCGRCHGGDATGGESGPNILGAITARNDADLAAFLREGRPSAGMPAFTLSQTELAELIPYMRSLVPIVTGNTLSAATKKFQTADGKSIEGVVLNEGMTDVQLRAGDGKIRLLRKMAGDKYRVVTSQTDWTTYNGDVGGNRFSNLTQINKTNVARMAPKWTFPIPNVGSVENTPIVVEGVMYVTSANECWALDAGTGRQIWHYQRPRTRGVAGNAAGGFNRGAAYANDRIFMLTDNAHIIALNRQTGDLVWETEMADWHQNYNGTSAPLTVGNLVISGTAGGDEGVRGFVAAFDQSTGKEVWRFWTVPKPGEPGDETWHGTNTEHRSGATWMTGSYDASTDTIYWQVGNPGPDFNGDTRVGDNLYTDCIVALDPKTGKLNLYYQFTPHDIHDWDAQEPAVIADTTWQGQPRKLLIQANRNGFFYVFDRTDGKLLLARPFLKKLNWAEAIGKDGRPIMNNLKENALGETTVCPGFQGGTNWFSTSFNPATNLYYFQAMERCNIFVKRTGEWQQGKGFMGGSARPVPDEGFEKVLRAVNIQTGEITWELPQVTGRATASAGVLSTASGVVFFGENSGSFMAADAVTGKALWQFPTNQVWKASPMTYMFDNQQYVAIAVGTSIVSYGLTQ